MREHTTPPGPAGASARANSGRGQAKQRIAERAEQLRREREAKGRAATAAAFRELVGNERTDKPFEERVRAAHPDRFDPMYQLPEPVPGFIVSDYKRCLRQLQADGYTVDELRRACSDWNSRRLGTTEPFFWFGPLARRGKFRRLAHYQLGLETWQKKGAEAGLAALLDDPDTARLLFTTSRSGKKRRENLEEPRAREGEQYKRLAVEYRNQNPASYLDAAVMYIVETLKEDPAWQARSPAHVRRRLREAGITAQTYRTLLQTGQSIA